MNTERLKKLMDTPEFKESTSKFVDKWMREEENLSRHVETVRKRIASMSNAEFLATITKLCEWELDYEEREYKRGRHATSNLFRVMFHAVAEKKNSRPCNEDFLHQKYILKGITFKLYVGQGSFYRITMGKRFIFQSV